MSDSPAVDRPYLDFALTESATRIRIAESDLPPIPVRNADHTEALRCVALAYTIDVTDLLGGRRHKLLTEARTVAYWLLRTQTRMSYPEIGRALCKDHTSAMVGVKRCERRRGEDAGFARFTDRLAVAVGARNEGRSK